MPDWVPPHYDNAAVNRKPVTAAEVCRHWAIHAMPMLSPAHQENPSDPCHPTLCWTSAMVRIVAAVGDAVQSRRPLDIAAPRGCGVTTLLRHLSNAAGMAQSPVRCCYAGPASDRESLRRWLQPADHAPAVLFRDRGCPIFRVPPGSATVITVREAAKLQFSDRIVRFCLLGADESLKVLRGAIASVGGREQILPDATAERMVAQPGGRMMPLAIGLRTALTRAAQRGAERIELQDLHEPVDLRAGRAA